MRFRINAALCVFAGAALALPLLAGCGSDSPAGGGNTGGSGFALPAGSYLVTFTPSACPSPFASAVGGGAETFELVACQDMSWADVLDLECPVTGSGNSFSIDCTFIETNGPCSTTYRVQGTATKTGNTWDITGMQEILSETPDGCSGDPACEAVTITVVEQSLGAPTACAWGAANTVGANVTGGPLGNVTMDAFGFPTPGSVGWSWSVSAFFGSTGGLPTSTFNLSGMNLGFPEIDPQSLPQTFGISMTPPGAELVGGGATVIMDYYEQHTDDGYFLGESATSGSFTVNEVSDKHIAGSYTVNMIGTSDTGSETRGVTGNFHVRAGSPGFYEYPAWRGYREAMKMVRSR